MGKRLRVCWFVMLIASLAGYILWSFSPPPIRSIVIDLDRGTFCGIGRGQSLDDVQKAFGSCSYYSEAQNSDLESCLVNKNTIGFQFDRDHRVVSSWITNCSGLIEMNIRLRRKNCPLDQHRDSCGIVDEMKRSETQFKSNHDGGEGLYFGSFKGLDLSFENATLKSIGMSWPKPNSLELSM